MYSADDVRVTCSVHCTLYVYSLIVRVIMYIKYKYSETVDQYYESTTYNIVHKYSQRGITHDTKNIRECPRIYVLLMGF